MSDNFSADGRKVREVWFEGNGNAFNERVKADEHRTMIFHNEYMGDHSEDWIIVYFDGKEGQRFNTRYVSNIVFAD